MKSLEEEEFEFEFKFDLKSSLLTIRNFWWESLGDILQISIDITESDMHGNIDKFERSKSLAKLLSENRQQKFLS